MRSFLGLLLALVATSAVWMLIVLPENAVSHPSLEPADACSCRLQNWNSLRIGVRRTPYNTADGRAARRHADVRAENGLSLARWHDTDSWDIDLWRSGLLVQVSFTTDESGLYGPFDATAFATEFEPLFKAAVPREPTAPIRRSSPQRIRRR